MEEELATNNFQTSQQNKKLTKKSQLKKTILNKNKYVEPNDEINKDNEKIVVIEDSTKLKLNQKETKAEFLIKLIMKAFYLSTWKRKVNSMKYYSRAYNPRRVNFKKLITEISLAIKQHKFEYFNELCENMDSFPMPSNVKHNSYYGTIRLISKEILFKKYTNKISMWADNNYNNKINGLKLDLINSIKQMKDYKTAGEQMNTNQKIGIDYSNNQKYIQSQENQIKKNDISNKENTNININQNNLQPYQENQMKKNEINNKAKINNNINQINQNQNLSINQNKNIIQTKINQTNQYNNNYNQNINQNKNITQNKINQTIIIIIKILIKILIKIKI